MNTEGLRIAEMAESIGMSYRDALELAKKGEFPPHPMLWDGKIIFSRLFREMVLDMMRQEDTDASLLVGPDTD